MEKYNLLIDTSSDGTHCILFANKYALSKEEVEKIFSQFGEVCNVKFHGDITGICFVRYRKITEAIRAIENLKDDPKITLLEHKKKKQRNCYYSETSQDPDQGRRECSGTQFIRQLSRPTNQKKNTLRNDTNGNYKENEHCGQFNNNLPGISNTNRYQKQNDVLLRSNSSNIHQKQSDIVQETQKNPRLYPKSNDRRSPRTQSNYQENDVGKPNLVHHFGKAMVEFRNQENEIPELVTSNGEILKIRSSMEKVILAEEVIVANIHPKFGAPYILHLFDCFEPLAITQVMIEPKTQKRYCHVYFKSLKASQGVETAFDRKSLLDQKLIVVRSSRLVEVAYFK